MSRRVLIVTGDAGDSYEALYACQRLQEARWEPVVAATSRRRLHMVVHPTSQAALKHGGGNLLGFQRGQIVASIKMMRDRSMFIQQKHAAMGYLRRRNDQRQQLLQQGVRIQRRAQGMSGLV